MKPKAILLCAATIFLNCVLCNGFLIPKSSNEHATPFCKPPGLNFRRLPQRKIQLRMSENTNKDALSKGLTLAIWTLPLDAVLIHFSGWDHFRSSLLEMKANASSGEEFAAALKFWLLGAISHPIMDAAFGISELLHASPGPLLAGLVPISFVLASGIFAWALVQSDKLRALAASTTLALFLAYVGAGLDGTSSNLLADYNIQLDDDYQGKVVKGCPGPQQVQSESIQSFDYQKYSGRWYWHEVHDWTQFHQMYNTMLDIQLTPTGYINTLQVQGPSQSSSPLSWDKSPLMHGIRYSWKGTIDPTTMGPGVSRESGFGVAFPNYIIDVVQSSSDNGQYQELVQFQCIEVGGVRLYEGIDFMSRYPIMDDNQLDAMHQRSSQLDPYGGSPDQMHRINQVDENGAQSQVNEWQALWNALGVERYLDQALKE